MHLQINGFNQLKAKIYIAILLIYSFVSQAFTQDTPNLILDTLIQDTIIPPALLDTLQAGKDSLVAAIDFKLSKDSLDAPVDYNAADSMIYDIADQKIHLYGEAFVNYQTITLKADYIVYDWKTNIVTAEGLPDSLGKMQGVPEFQDGDQKFNADRMRYNFRSRKGIIYDVETEQNGVRIKGDKSKFVAGERIDTTQSDDTIYSQGAIFTTCVAEHPHFGIRSTKQKVIPDKLVVIGPSNLEIMGVPTPIWLPFGFFPLSSGRRTGLLFPRDYEYSQQWGFGLRDIGWFFPLGEHFNLSLTGNIYIRGTWGINARSDYRKRYRYSGNFDLGYDVRRNESADGTVAFNRSFGLTWSHRQDANAHPSNNFGGTINFQTNNYQSRVFNDARSVLQNTINSNFSFSKNWQNSPISMNASFSHSQNTQTRKVTVNFPQVNFQTQTLYPFRRKKRVGKERWYETITLRYQGEFRNRLEGTDTTFFDQETFDNAEFGVRHQATSGTSFKLFKYFNLNPNVNYQEVWYFNTIRRDFDPTPQIEFDTIVNSVGEISIIADTTDFGTVDERRVWGFEPYRTVSTGLTLNTKIFGTMKFSKGWLRGIRHTITPSISFNYTPDYTDPSLGYFDQVQTDSRFPDDLQQYSIFEGGIYGIPSSSGRQMALSYSFSNNFDGKYYSKKDSTEKKFKLFNRFVINGNYNFAADSLKFSQVSMSGSSQFFKNITNVFVSLRFDPYIQENGRRVNKFAWNEQRRLLRFVNANMRFNTNLTVGKIRALFQGQEQDVVEDVRDQQRNKQVDETDFLSLFENFSINHNLSLDWSVNSENRDTFRITTNNINLRGNIQLTKNWAVTVGNFGYDFVRETLSYPFVGFRRDLHCWEMGLNWAPTRGTYNFYIQVKPGMLDFIRIPYDRNNADAFNPF